MNDVTIVGRLTKDPILNKTATGKSVMTVFIALNRSYESSDGQTADYPPVQVWGKSAENLAKYCKQGDLVGIKGHLKTEYNKNIEGPGAYSMVVVAEKIEYLSKKKNSTTSQEHDNAAADTSISLDEDIIGVDEKMKVYMENLQSQIPQD